MRTIAEKRAERHELDKIERSLKIGQDQYNSTENIIVKEDYEKILQADLEYAPKKGETYESYYARLKIYVEYARKKNIKSHISGPKGAWWTHRNPSGCFCCEDMNLMSVMIQTMHLQALKYPEATF